jgi:glycosyltransferase involved in cell wall biosynthesis
MHIAIVVPRLHGGGAETVAREWIAELRGHGHEITVYAYAPEQPKVDLAPGTVVHGISPRGGFIRPAFMPIWLHIRIRRDQPDVVVSLLPFSNVIAWLALRVGRGRSVPLLVSEHNVPSLQVGNDRRRDKLTEWVARRLYRHAAGVLTVSHPIAGEIVSAYRVPADRIFVVPNPVVQASPDAASA